MKLLDPTDPSEWADIARRVHAVARDFEERQQQTRKRKKLLAKVRHKASVVAANKGGSMEAPGELMAAVDELVKAGIPPSNKELRETLLPVLDQLPTQPDMPDGFRLAAHEINKFKQNVLSLEAASEDPEPVGIIQDARKLLEGGSAVFIGGEGRTEASEALEQSLGLKELIWISTSKHDSYLDFERFVARPDVAVILLAIRWSSHSFGEISSLFERHGKPLVRLPGGYNPNQVAHQIVTQAGLRLVTK